MLRKESLRKEADLTISSCSKCKHHKHKCQVFGFLAGPALLNESLPKANHIAAELIAKKPINRF